jgi:hypothetical protein
MTPEQIISIIRNGAVGKEVHPEVVRFNIGLAYSDILGRYDDLTPYRKTYKNVAVVKDTDTDRYYSELPAPALNMLYAVKIMLPKSSAIDFIPVQDNTWGVMQNLDAGLVTDKIAYKVRADSVEYENMTTEIPYVNMEIVRPFEAYDEDEQVPLIPQLIEQVIDLATRYLAGVRHEKKQNDGNKNTP